MKKLLILLTVLLVYRQAQAQDSLPPIKKPIWVSFEIGKAGLTNLDDRLLGFSLRGHVVKEIRPWLAVTGGFSFVQASVNEDWVLPILYNDQVVGRYLRSRHDQGHFGMAEAGLRFRVVRLGPVRLFAAGGGLLTVGSNINESLAYFLPKGDNRLRNFVVMYEPNEFAFQPDVSADSGNGTHTGLGYWFQAQLTTDLSPNCRLSASGLFQNSIPANMAAPSLNLGIQFRLK